MNAYQYFAIKKNGSNCKGVVEADSERHARQILRKQGILPTEVHPLKKSIQKKGKNGLKSQELSLLTRQLATLLAAGIPIDEALRGVAEQSENENSRKIIISVRTKVLEGYGLAQALAEFPRAFPEIYRATIAAGEQTGNLDMVLEKLATYTEKQQKTKHKIQQALIYPSLMVIISIGIVSFLLAFVVPKIIDVFTTGGQELPTTTKILIKISSFIQNYGLYALLLFIIFCAIFLRCLKISSFKTKWHKFLLQIPILAFLIKSVNVSRYIHTFSILFAAGVNILETMRVSASLINNKIIQTAFNQATIQVKEGSAINTALHKTMFLSPMATHLIASGEKSGNISAMMERAASYLDDEVKRIIDASLTLLEPMIILLMGAMVLFIVLSILLPIFSMEQLV